MKYIFTLILSFIIIGCGGTSTQDSSTIQVALSSPTQEAQDWYKPSIDTSWQWQLSGNVNTSYPVELFDIDLFDTDQAVIDDLHAQGKKVICYFSAGSYENWRSDKAAFDSSVLGNNLDGWAGEKWLDISSDLIRPIMQARLDLAQSKGCDGVEPDNVDGYTNNTGFALSANDQLNYNKFLANEAHKRGLSIGLKNNLDQVQELEPHFDFAVNEQCHQYSECDALYPFIDNAKPVFNAEYKQSYVDNSDSQRDIMCTQAYNNQFQTLVLPLDLDDSFRIDCI